MIFVRAFLFPLLKEVMPTEKEKVLAYIIRKNGGEKELLVFDHMDFPEAGTQVPAGTVDPGESIEKALLREIQEESGLKFEKPENLLGRFKWYRADREENHTRNVFELLAPSGLPENWELQVGGSGDDKGLRFRYFWLPINEARSKLAAEQGLYLDFSKI